MTGPNDLLAFDLVLYEAAPGTNLSYKVSRLQRDAKPFWLPKGNVDTLEKVGTNLAGDRIHKFTIPRWLADDRGLTDDRAQGVDDLFSTTERK